MSIADIASAQRNILFFTSFNQVIMKKFLFAAFLVIISSAAIAQKNKPVTISFRVEGICGMCEKKIESALDAKGILTADYQLDTNTATVTYNPKKITEDRIHFLINEMGYDTEKSKATDEQYSRTHGCCKYREQEKH